MLWVSANTSSPARDIILAAALFTDLPSISVTTMLQYLPPATVALSYDKEDPTKLKNINIKPAGSAKAQGSVYGFTPELLTDASVHFHLVSDGHCCGVELAAHVYEDCAGLVGEHIALGADCHHEYTGAELDQAITRTDDALGIYATIKGKVTMSYDKEDPTKLKNINIKPADCHHDAADCDACIAVLERAYNAGGVEAAGAVYGLAVNGGHYHVAVLARPAQSSYIWAASSTPQQWPSETRWK